MTSGWISELNCDKTRRKIYKNVERYQCTAERVRKRVHKQCKNDRKSRKLFPGDKLWRIQESCRIDWAWTQLGYFLHSFGTFTTVPGWMAARATIVEEQNWANEGRRAPWIQGKSSLHKIYSHELHEEMGVDKESEVQVKCVSMSSKI